MPIMIDNKSRMIDGAPETFFPLLHAMLRATPSTPEEDARARDVMRWAAEHVQALVGMMDVTETRLFKVLIDHWRDFREAPNRQTLEDMVRKQNLPDLEIGLLGDYDRYLPHLPLTDHIAVQACFKTRFEDWRKQRFKFALQTANLILDPGMAPNSYKDPPRKGVKDSIDFLQQELNSGVFSPGGGDSQGGSALELGDLIMDMHDDNEAAFKAGTLSIHTGISLIDDQMGGLGKKTLNLIMGHAGHRKSAVARTIAYYAALSGFRTMFIPLEWPYQEEIQIFAMMHAHNLLLQGTENFSISRFRDGKLDKGEKELMRAEIVPSFKADLGTDLVIRSTEKQTWASIRQLIEAENANAPLDLVVIDYITLFDLSDVGFDKTFAMHQHVRELKQMCMHLNGDRGVVVVSPVQCNRKGYLLAKLNGGVWEATDIWQYGEMEKSADNIMYTYMPDDLMRANQMKLGFAKTRRHGPIAPQVVDVDPKVSLVGGSPIVRYKDEKEMAELIGGRVPDGRTGVIQGKRKPKPVSDGSMTVEEIRRMIKGPAAPRW
jgi:hypothetical protein